MAVIGTLDQVLPFKAMGAELYITDDVKAASEAVVRFAEEKYIIILISDDLIKGMDDVLDRFSSSPTPAITAIPGRSGTSSFYNKKMNFMIKKSIGIDIFETGEN